MLYGPPSSYLPGLRKIAPLKINPFLIFAYKVQPVFAVAKKAVYLRPD